MRPGDFDEDAIAHLAADAVIDRSETFQVEISDRDAAPGTLLAADGGLHAVGKQRAVG